MKEGLTRLTISCALALLGASCAPSYVPHAVAGGGPDARRVLGCLEIGVVAARDPSFPASSLFVQVALENHCHEPEGLDLAAMRMTAFDTDGTSHPIEFYDPRHEIVRVHIDGDATALERFRVDAAGLPGRLASVCFDPSNVTAPAVASTPICYDFCCEANAACAARGRVATVQSSSSEEP